MRGSSRGNSVTGSRTILTRTDEGRVFSPASLLLYYIASFLVAVAVAARKPPSKEIQTKQGYAMTKDFPRYPDLDGKVALITGIGQVGIPNSPTWGNGAATARVLSHNGVKIVGCDINLGAAQYTRQRLLQDNPLADVEVISTDVTNTADVERLVKFVLDKHGQIDILINNVGMTAPGDPGSMAEELWLKQIDLNLNSVYRLCHAVLPAMERQGSGAVINNASITALRYIGKPQIA
jgi:hypothetical protein